MLSLQLFFLSLGHSCWKDFREKMEMVYGENLKSKPNSITPPQMSTWSPGG